jgi:hypothetical protein
MSEQWRNLLPTWFIKESASEIVDGSSNHGWDNSFEDSSLSKQAWSVEAFVFWFKPNERYWFWWDAKIESSTQLIIEIIAPDVPFPWGALEWLFRASGARKMVEI